MPHHLTSKGQRAPWQDGMPRHDHPCRWTNRLGILQYLRPEGKWQATSVLGSLWPQQGHLPWSSQDAHCGGSCSWVCTLLLLHSVRCLPWILVNHPWPGLQLAYDFQQSLWKILFPATSLWPGLFPRHLPEEDGPDPWRMPGMHWNHRWHHCPWLHWGRTWCPPMRSHADCLQIWLGVQSTENTCEGSSCQFLQLPLWCQWCPPRPGKGRCCTCLTSTHKHHRTPRVLRSSHIPKPFIPGLSTLTAPLQELLKKDTDFIWNHTYDATFEWVKEAVVSDTTLKYFNPSLPVTIQVNASKVGLGAALLENGKPIAFARKALTETECQFSNIERDASCCLWSREIPHLHLWTVLHDQIRPQATWIHLQKEPSRHSCMATMHDVMPTGIWLHNPLLPR